MRQRKKVNGKVTIRPGIASYDYQTIGTFYTDAQELGIANSHMAKNSEWGAMTYLTHSKYGEAPILNGNTWAWNEGKYYIEKVSLSTTGNIYGIYDTFGLRNEVVAGYIADSSNSNGNSFASTDNTVNNKNVSTKFATVYFMSESNKWNSNYQFNINKKFGDAIVETSTGGIQTSAWSGKLTEFPSIDYYGKYTRSYFTRGGNNASNGGGPLSFGCGGASACNDTFRMCLITK